MKNYNLPCNIAQTLNLIGDKWSLLIVFQILSNFQTYGEIQSNLDGIPSNLLSERLKALEADDIIMRNLYQDHPPRYKYTLTQKGADLSHIFNAMIIWGEKHLEKCYTKLVHNDCKDGNIEHRYVCTSCGEEVNYNEISIKTNLGE